MCPTRLYDDPAFRALSFAGQAILGALMRFRDDRTEVTWVSATTLAAAMGKCEATVRRNLSKIEAAGLIHVERRAGRSPLIRFVGSASLYGDGSPPADGAVTPASCAGVDHGSPHREAPGLVATPAPQSGVPRRVAPEFTPAPQSGVERTPAPDAPHPGASVRGTPAPRADDPESQNQEPPPDTRGADAYGELAGGGGAIPSGGGGTGEGLAALDRVFASRRRRAADDDQAGRDALRAAAEGGGDPAGWERAVAAAGGRAAEPDRAAAAAALLERLGAAPHAAASAVADHGPAAVAGWARYAANAKGVENRAGLALAKLRAGMAPPAHGGPPPGPAPGVEPLPDTRASALADLSQLTGIELVEFVRAVTGGATRWPPASWTDELVLAVWLRSSVRRRAAREQVRARATA
jgi:hypothetical protein